MESNPSMQQVAFPVWVIQPEDMVVINWNYKESAETLEGTESRLEKCNQWLHLSSVKAL